MTDPVLLQASEGAVRTLTLNRPEALNAFTSDLHAALRGALDDAAADESVRCLVVTGAGRGFCAGQDLNDEAMVGENVDFGDVIERLYRPLALRLRSMPVPVIAAVNGVAAGAGANLALGCDFVVAARSASFIQAFSKIGLVPDCGGSWLLPRLVGRARALGLTMTGDKLLAEEAQRIGLIWQCVDDDELPPAVAALAQRLVAMPSRALARTRRLLDESGGVDYAAALRLEAEAQREMGASQDYREGVAAFLERRPAQFRDR